MDPQMAGYWSQMYGLEVALSVRQLNGLPAIATYALLCSWNYYWFGIV